MRHAPLLLTSLFLAAGPVLAASPPPPQNGEPGANKSGETLSEKLDKGKGVIKPRPGADPGIVKPAPELPPQSTPVIPPPAPNAK